MTRTATYLRMNSAELEAAGEAVVRAAMAESGFPLFIEDMAGVAPPDWATQLATLVAMKGRVTQSRNGPLDPSTLMGDITPADGGDNENPDELAAAERTPAGYLEPEQF